MESIGLNKQLLLLNFGVIVWCFQGMDFFAESSFDMSYVSLSLFNWVGTM